MFVLRVPARPLPVRTAKARVIKVICKNGAPTVGEPGAFRGSATRGAFTQVEQVHVRQGGQNGEALSEDNRTRCCVCVCVSQCAIALGLFSDHLTV